MQKPCKFVVEVCYLERTIQIDFNFRVNISKKPTLCQDIGQQYLRFEADKSTKDTQTEKADFLFP